MELLNFILSELDLYRFVQTQAPTGDLMGDNRFWGQYRILYNICEQNRRTLDGYYLTTPNKSIPDKNTKKKPNEMKTNSWWDDIELMEKEKAKDNPYYNLPKPSRAELSRLKREQQKINSMNFN